jgi:uncharacterized surface protein with fasciclin (FAS1) repeats
MKATTAPKAVELMSNGTPPSAKPSSVTTQPIAKKSSPYRAEKVRTEKSLVERNLVETAAVAGFFGTFGRALWAAGLVDMLSGTGPFTVFAPTDEAFAAMPKADLDALLEDKAKLTQVLTYHVVPEIVIAPKEGSPRLATTVNGAGLKITAKKQGFRVNDATVVKTEILASNGVIHAIDTLLTPR